MNDQRWEERRHAIARRLESLPWRTAVLLLVIAAILVAIRLAAPLGMKWFLNRKLAALPDYRGHVGDVDLSLIGGEVAVDDLRLDKRGGNPDVPFLRASRIEVD